MGKNKGLNLTDTIIDFHTHSNRSDGSDEREKVVERAIAEANGKKVIMAITDHNIIFDDMEELQQKYGDKVVLVPGIDEAFDLYFGSYGKRTCYVDNPHKYMSVSEAVNAAKKAGGVAILAHPYYYQLDESELFELVAHFKECGGEGIESEYGKYGNEERASLKAIVRKFDLLESCGSDYHGNAGEHFQTNCTEVVLRLAERVM